MVTKIYLPAMRHPIINGVRLGLGVALIGTLLAETKLSNKGIGFLIINAYSTFDMPRMYAMLIVLFVLAIGANALVGPSRRSRRHKKNLTFKQNGSERMKHVGWTCRRSDRHGDPARRPAAADDVVKIDHRPARQLGHRDHASRRKGRHLQEARAAARDDLHLGQRRDFAARDLWQRRPRSGGRHARRHGCVFKGRAGAHHRRPGDRRCGLLVRQEPSPIKTLKDTNGHTIAFSTNGSSTNSVVRAFIDEFKLTAKPTGHRQPERDAHRRDDRSGRCRLGRAAVRPQGD